MVNAQGLRRGCHRRSVGGREDRDAIGVFKPGRDWRSPGPKEVGVPMVRRGAHAGPMTTDNKTIVKEFIDRLFTEDDVSVLDELAAPDYVDHDPPFGGMGS